ATLMTGKWHIRSEPTQRGFDRYFGHLSGATNFFRGDKTFRLDGQPFAVPREGFYTTTANTDYAIRFLDESTDRDRPFFLYIAYNAPHYPLQAPREAVEKYRGRYSMGWEELRRRRHARQREMGLFAKPWKLSPPHPEAKSWDALTTKQKEAEDLKMATYAAMIDLVDQNVGRLLAKLKGMAAYENTLILFLSDNGACPFDRTRRGDLEPWNPDSYWCYHQAWANACNTPLRWFKQNQHEGGISTPLIAHWPVGLDSTRGTITHQPGHLIDIMATCLDVAGTEYPKKHRGEAVKPLRGRSLLPVLRGGRRQGHEALFFQFSNNRAVRMGQWKLVSARGGPWELYDLASDRTELNDLAGTQPERARRMAAAWEQWAKEVGAAAGKKKRGSGKKKKTAGSK
ncbi:MAG: sulfatase-like hydrolase/transferase, partial [Phycisphaerae bacterium]|nr:sulfatase-like hydrolase/transferase [Phycisphaerae bacterium]